jgi:hypothetical protein
MRRIMTALTAVCLVAGAAQAQAQGQGDHGKGNPKAASGKPAGQGGNRGAAQHRQSAAVAVRASPGADKGRGNDHAVNRGNDRRTADRQATAPRSGAAPRNDDRTRNARPTAVRVEAQAHDRNRPAPQRAAVQPRPAPQRAVVERRPTADRRPVVVERRPGNDRRPVIVERGRPHADRVVVIDQRGRGPDRQFVSLGRRGLISGCPPGLAKKHNGCQSPGQTYVAWSDRRPDWWGMRNLDSGRYVYRDGYLLRVDGPRIGGYVPLLGGALGPGRAWPAYYQPVRLPTYYEDYYGIGPYNSYRYADNVIYRVNPQTTAITSIAALLTGEDFIVGQPMPLGYDVYNVPYPYRTQYVDGPAATYRYSDGYVYQIDPTTQLIAAAIQLALS